MTITRSSAPAPLPVPVLDEPHWRILLRPSDYAAERIATLADCWRHVEAAKVGLRGWDYPWVDSIERQQGDDWISSWCDWSQHLEFWQFYQSGQFIHLLGFWENRADEEVVARALQRIRVKPEGFESTGVIDAPGVVYTLSEVFEFARRLAARGVFGHALVVDVRMGGISGRPLVTLDRQKAPFRQLHAAAEDRLEHRWTVTLEDILARSGELALDAAVWFFERFGWLDPPREVLRQDQERLLAHRLLA